VRWKTIFCLSWSERAALIEAALWITIASVTIAVLPFGCVRRLGERPARRAERSPARHAEVLRKVRWSILACARRVPWRAKCFQQGLAAHCMLRSKGVPSILYYGVAPARADGLTAHVWVGDGDKSIFGENVTGFAVLATLPRTPSSASSV
jgi:hypothetical protein